MADIILSDPPVMTVASRFGINPGVGDSTIGEMCSSRGINEPLLLAILNIFCHENYFPEKELRTIDPKLIVEYLEKTDIYYERYQLPNIEHHFDLLIKCSSGSNSNLSILRKFFTEMKIELQQQIRYDRTYLFPALVSPQGYAFNADLKIVNTVIEDKLSDLLQFFIVHLKGNYDENLCCAVVNAIFTLKKDIMQNNRIRERILAPILELR